jgi:hypothetical protein
MKKLFVAIAVTATLFISGCNSDAQIASQNLSKAADNFEILRRVVFYNGVTDKYIMTVEGRCSINHDSSDNQLEVTYAYGPNEIKKEFFGLSDNTAYFVQQMENADVSRYHYRVVFKPQSIVPDIDFRGSTTDLPRNQK